MSCGTHNVARSTEARSSDTVAVSAIGTGAGLPAALAIVSCWTCLVAVESRPSCCTGALTWQRVAARGERWRVSGAGQGAHLVTTKRFCQRDLFWHAILHFPLPLVFDWRLIHGPCRTRIWIQVLHSCADFSIVKINGYRPNAGVPLENHRRQCEAAKQTVKGRREQTQWRRIITFWGQKAQVSDKHLVGHGVRMGLCWTAATETGSH